MKSHRPHSLIHNLILLQLTFLYPSLTVCFCFSPLPYLISSLSLNLSISLILLRAPAFLLFSLLFPLPSSSNFSASPAFLVLFFSHGSHPVGPVPSHAPCAFSFSLPLPPLQSPSISSILSFLASLLSGDYLTFRHSCVSVWERPLSISLPLPVRLASHSSIPFPFPLPIRIPFPKGSILYVISIFIYVSLCSD